MKFLAGVGLWTINSQLHFGTDLDLASFISVFPVFQNHEMGNFLAKPYSGSGILD